MFDPRFKSNDLLKSDFRQLVPSLIFVLPVEQAEGHVEAWSLERGFIIHYSLSIINYVPEEL